MSNYDKHLDAQKAALINATAYKGKLYALAAKNVAEAWDLTVTKYDPVADLFYFSDGEPYSSSRIAEENFLIKSGGY